MKKAQRGRAGLLPVIMALLLLLEITACGAARSAEPPAAPMETSPAALSAASSGFSDVPDGAWYAGAVEYCRQHSIMNGVSDTAFAPEDSLTRAMLATVFYRMSGSPAVSGPSGFRDVQAGAWCSDAVAWAAENGIVNGCGNHVFGVNDPTTREQAVTILWRYAGSPEGGGETDASDAAGVSDWAKAAVRWAESGDILEGMTESGRFDPETNIKRGEVASMLYHYLNDPDASLELPSHSEEISMNKITVSFNGHTYSATLEDNPSAKAFAELLESGPLTIAAHDYGGFEKVGELESALPRSDERITTSAGDIILYQGNQITVYYAQNTWSFTRLGRIDDPSGLRDNLGGGDVTITFALANAGDDAEDSGQ